MGGNAVKRVCIDLRDGRYGWCWCEGGRLVCVDLPRDAAVRELSRGTPLCTKDFCGGGGE